MNLILMQSGYPPVIIRKQDRLKYYQFLETANEGDIRPFVREAGNPHECSFFSLSHILYTFRIFLLSLT